MERLKTGAERMGIELSDIQLRQFQDYMSLLLDWNERINLTAITEEDEIISKHFLDSMTLICSEKLKVGDSLIDIGAGAGFPSIPVKIARPDLNITMLDSLNKRIDFLDEVVSKLELKDIEAIHSRAEDGARTYLRESFDIATARAVANLAILAEYTLPYVKVGGYFVAMKGTAPEEEINSSKPAIKAMGGKIEEVKEVFIEDGQLEHTLIIIKKIEKTPSKYPRKAGKPAKDPIKQV